MNVCVLIFLVVDLFTFFANYSMSGAVKGGLSAHSSYNKHPNDQMSLLVLYGLSLQISGDA